MRSYRDDSTGRVLFVSPVRRNDGTWGTYYRDLAGGFHRVTASSLPIRSSRDQAERDLDDYAAARNLTPNS